ncbi:RNA-directed DNA polymerase, eukaryota, reverse transcriptase zinc-binding domain protein, partial [Tanacetum coccineum]
WVNNHATFAKLRDVRAMKLYKCEKTAKDMRWHDTGRTKDGKLRHAADGLAWSAFNDRHSQFASNPRSVRLGLASDGFNPLDTTSTSHSTWPLSGIRFKYGKSKKRTREEDVGSTSTHAKKATHDNEGTFECTSTIIEEDIDSENLLWKKKSVFFDLEYWEHNLLRHNLDVMHIEKSVSDNIMGTLLGLDEKTKDNKNAHLKVPDGYSSNISRGVSVKDHKISNLKIKAVTDYCFFYKGLCAKVLDPSELDKMEYQLARTLCKWMYPVERYLMQLKSYVCNKAQPKGSIVKAYIKEECLNFCSRYFEGVETPFNRPPRNDENVVGKEMYMFNSSGRKLGKVEILKLDGNSSAQAHRCVSLLQEENVDEEVLSLAIGPNIAAKQYKGFITNGYGFLTRQREEFKKT